jgi:hypothetical protein
MFYDDTLIASADAKLISWSELPNPEIPILFQGCETEENWVDEGAVSSKSSRLSSPGTILARSIRRYEL